MTTLYMPSVTMEAAALLGLLFLVLSVQVVLARTSSKFELGTGAEPSVGQPASPLLIAARSHANFAEYVPLTLLLIGAIEMHTGRTVMVQLLAGGLVLARLLHPIGMRLKAPNPFRAGGFMLTITVLVIASVKGLLLAFS